MNTEDWTDEQQKLIDLTLENSSLEEEIALKCGGTIEKPADIDPYIENQFLKNVLAFEETEKEEHLPMRSLFPDDYKFPPAESMSPKELSEKLEDICGILSVHNIEFGFANDLPDKVLYRHIVDECIANDTVSPSVAAGFTLVLDGCTGLCEECFQKEYCKTAQELENEE